MKILVIGGSYFLGKCFVNLAREKHQLTVFNRGSRPLKLPGVQEIYGERHDEKVLLRLKEQCYDVVVDFCAYQKKDILSLFQVLEGKMKQYIYVSTCDVYERGLNRVMDETAPFEYREFGGEAGNYISGKVALEEELLACAGDYPVKYTSIRPAFIYGPGNYAPREGIYFHWIKNAGQILHPIDATGEFQMVYVEDVARAIFQSLGNPEAYGQAYNLAPLQMETYNTFSEALAESVDTEFKKVPISLSMVYEKNIPLPFPLIKEESNWYDGNKALSLIGQYTGLQEGLKKTVKEEKIFS